MTEPGIVFEITRKLTTCLIIIAFVLSGVSCSRKQDAKKKELLVYCGVTMIRPMTEIAEMIEEQENCRITLIKGGSGNLLDSIVHNKCGDLYLPGSDRYYRTIENEYSGLVTDTVFVGHNKAVLMVRKGNPLGITADLINLTLPDYGVVIGNPESGSIGKEAKKILESRGIYEEVVRNIMSFTTDSKDLAKAINNKEADIVINWFAVSTWDDNPMFMDVIEIDPEFAETKKLILGLLKYSEHPDIAGKFIELAGSDKGRTLFAKYGLYFDEAEKE